MQQTNGAANTYLANKVMTSSPQEITLMLYDGALRFCNRAITNIDEGNIEEAHKFIIKTQNIIEEFMIVVDRKYEVGNNLYLMYEYMYRRLIEANFHKDKTILTEVIGLLQGIRDSWKEAMDKEKGGPSASVIKQNEEKSGNV